MRVTANRSACKTLAALLALAASPALAQDAQDAQGSSKLYAGAGVAMARYTSEVAGVELSDSSPGFEAYGGYRLPGMIDVELGYKRFGAIDARDVAGSGTNRLDIDASFETVLVKGIWSVSFGELLGWRRDVRMFGAAGYYRTVMDATAVTLGSGARDTLRDEESGLLFGVGALYDVGAVDLRGYVDWFGVDDRNEAWNAGVTVQISF